MKSNIKWLGLGGVGVLLAFFGARGCAAMRNPLDFVGVNAAGATVIAQKSYGSLTDNEDFIELEATPVRFASIVKQFQNRAKTGANYGGIRFNSPEVKAFFAAAPASARVGSFVVEENKGEKDQWFILCDFAADKKTGRIYLYAWSVYN